MYDSLMLLSGAAVVQMMEVLLPDSSLARFECKRQV